MIINPISIFTCIYALFFNLPCFFIPPGTMVIVFLCHHILPLTPPPISFLSLLLQHQDDQIVVEGLYQEDRSACYEEDEVIEILDDKETVRFIVNILYPISLKLNIHCAALYKGNFVVTLMYICLK